MSTRRGCWGATRALAGAASKICWARCAGISSAAKALAADTARLNSPRREWGDGFMGIFHLRCGAHGDPERRTSNIAERSRLNVQRSTFNLHRFMEGGAYNAHPCRYGQRSSVSASGLFTIFIWPGSNSRGLSNWVATLSFSLACAVQAELAVLRMRKPPPPAAARDRNRRRVIPPGRAFILLQTPRGPDSLNQTKGPSQPL